MDLEEMMQMIDQMLRQPPEQAAGSAPTSLPGGAVPPDISENSPEKMLMDMLMQLLQGQQQQTSPRQGMNAPMGVMGAAQGGMGGRPPAGSVSPSLF